MKSSDDSCVIVNNYTYLPNGRGIDSVVLEKFNNWKKQRSKILYKRIILEIILCCFWLFIFLFYGFDLSSVFFIAIVSIYFFCKISFNYKFLLTLKKANVVYCVDGVIVKKEDYNTAVRSVSMVYNVVIKTGKEEFAVRSCLREEYKKLKVGDNVCVFAFDKNDVYIMK